MIQLIAALAGALMLAYALTQALLTVAYAADDALARRRMPAPDPLTRAYDVQLRSNGDGTWTNIHTCVTFDLVAGKILA